MKRRKADSGRTVEPATEAVYAALAVMSSTELLEIMAKAKEHYDELCAHTMASVPDEIWERIILQFPPGEVRNHASTVCLPSQLFHLAPVCKAWQSFTQFLLNNQYSQMCGTPYFSFSKMPGVRSLERHVGMPDFDLPQLSCLTNLESLKLVYFHPSISTLTKLTKLVVIQHWAFTLPTLSNAPEANAQGSERLDVRALLPLTNLVSLEVLGNYRASIQPLSVLTNLKRIKTEMVSGVSDCILQWTHLTKLTVRNREIISDELTTMTNLVSLGLNVDDVAKISHLTNLRSLDVSKMSLPQDFFKTWDKLESVFITRKQLGVHLDDLKNLKNLKKIRGVGKFGKIYNDDAYPPQLTALTNLTTLYSEQNFCPSVASYPESLTELSIEREHPLDLGCINKLTNLKSLRLFAPQLDVSDFFKYVSNLTSLTRLHVEPMLDDEGKANHIGLDGATVLTNLTDLQVYGGECITSGREFAKRFPKLKILGHSGWPIGLDSLGILELMLEHGEMSDSNSSASISDVVSSESDDSLLDYSSSAFDSSDSSDF